MHKIVTPEASIVRDCWRRIPYHCYHLVQDEIKMLKQGMITLLHSPWRSPIVTVPKKDETLWLCVDFHASGKGITGKNRTSQVHFLDPRSSIHL